MFKDNKKILLWGGLRSCVAPPKIVLTRTRLLHFCFVTWTHPRHIIAVCRVQHCQDVTSQFNGGEVTDSQCPSIMTPSKTQDFLSVRMIPTITLSLLSSLFLFSFYLSSFSLSSLPSPGLEKQLILISLNRVGTTTLGSSGSKYVSGKQNGPISQGGIRTDLARDHSAFEAKPGLC